MSNSLNLQILANHREALLRVEVGALIHNIGKLSQEFLKYKAGEKGFEHYDYKAIVGIVTQLMPNSLATQARQRLDNALNANKETVTSSVLSAEQKKWLMSRDLELPAPLDSHKYALGDFIEFQDFGWYKTTKGGAPPRITLLFPSGSPVTELLEASHDAASSIEKEGTPKDYGKQDKFYLSTAFGFETPIQDSDLKTRRDELLDALRLYGRRANLTNLEKSVGDTRRPINEVLLSDLSFSVATFLKSAIAQVILTKKWTPRDYLRWRLLRVNFNVLGLYAKAIKIADLLGYQEAVERACEKVKHLVEEEYPLGNEIYRDTTGIYFTFPDLDLPADLEREIRRRVETVEPELAPRIAVEPPQGNTTAEQLKRMLADARKQAREKLALSFDQQNHNPCWQQQWDNLPDDDWEVCPVCRLRPMKEGQEACVTCLKRRRSRIQAWKHKLHQTIWINEIADHNDRVALIVGQLGLDDWLSGDLVQTMLVRADSDPTKCVPKNPSPARLRRVWRTCEQFWEKTVQKDILSTLAKVTRCNIVPDTFNKDEGLYNGKVNGKPLDLFWQPNDGAFLTVSNLKVAGEIKKGDEVLLEDPKTKQKFEFRITNITEALSECYRPYLTLTVSPDQFLAFVPAAEAPGIVRKIRDKYEEQFSKVRNRLPLFLGLIFFERKMPLMAVMDAARHMFDRPSRAESWQVQTKTDHNPTPQGWPRSVQLTLTQKDKSIPVEIPTVMGDDATNDLWYPYWRVEGKATDRARWFVGPDGEHWVHASELRAGDCVQFTPSRFDFIYLDAASRRFDIAYDRQGRRPSRPTRPFYLEDLERLEQVWETFSKKLTSTQQKQVLQTIEITRERWFGPNGLEASAEDRTFEKFVEDTLANAQWEWKNLPNKDLLIAAAARGELADLAELHLEILKEKSEKE